MKKVIPILLFSILFSYSICSAAVYYTYEMISPTVNADLTYEDESIIVKFGIPRKDVKFISLLVYNKTEDAIELDWNQVSITCYGQSLPIAPMSALIIDAKGQRDFASTFIPPHASVNESVVAKQGIYYDTAPAIFGGQHYDVQPLFPVDKSGLKKTGMNTGGEFGLYLPMLFNAERKNYHFNFKITNIETKKVPGLLGVSSLDKTLEKIYNKNLDFQYGAYIITTEKNSAADKAGLKKDDIIIAIDSIPVNNLDDLSKILNEKYKDDEIKITYLRGTLKKDTTVKLGKYR